MWFAHTSCTSSGAHTRELVPPQLRCVTYAVGVPWLCSCPTSNIRKHHLPRAHNTSEAEKEIEAALLRCPTSLVVHAERREEARPETAANHRLLPSISEAGATHNMTTLSQDDIFNCVGTTGGCILACALIPQIVLAHKRRSAEDISYMWQVRRYVYEPCCSDLLTFKFHQRRVEHVYLSSVYAILHT